MKQTHKSKTVIGLTLGVFLAALESTVVATAMPEVIDDLGGNHLYSLPFSVYLLTSTVSNPIWGKLSDVFNRKNIYILGIILFLTGSFLSGLSQSMHMLIAMRVIQGLGAGCMTPLTFIINAELFSVEKRAKVQGYMSAVWGLAGLFGPLIGGLIVDWLNWRYVFYLNLPFGLLAWYMVHRYFHEDKESRPQIQIDYIGTLFFIAGISVLVYGLELQIWWLAGSGIILTLISYFIQRRQASPILPIKSMQQKIPSTVLILNFLAGMAFFGILAFLPLYVQSVANRGATAAGLVLTPMVVGWTLTNIIGGRIIHRTTLIGLIHIGFTILIIGFGGFLYFYNADILYLSVCGFMVGCGMGFGMLGTILSMQEYSAREELGSSTSGVLFARTIGGSIGVSILSAIIGKRLLGTNLQLQDGFFDAYLTCLIIVTLALLLALRLKKIDT